MVIIYANSSYTVIHSQHLTHDTGCKQTDGRWVSSQGLRRTCAVYAHISLAVFSNRVSVHFSSGRLCVCLQAVSNEAPTSLHLSDCSQGSLCLPVPYP